MNNKTLQEMNDAYKDCPVRTSEYTIDGKKYIVKSHFVGAKELNDVLYRIAFEHQNRIMLLLIFEQWVRSKNIIF